MKRILAAYIMTLTILGDRLEAGTVRLGLPSKDSLEATILRFYKENQVRHIRQDRRSNMLTNLHGRK